MVAGSERIIYVEKPPQWNSCMLSGALFEAARRSNNKERNASVIKTILWALFCANCFVQGKKCIFFHYAVWWQVSGIPGDSGVEFGKESGTRCCQGTLQTFGLFCSPKVICLLIIVPFFLHQPCEIWALGLHASSQSDEVFFFLFHYYMVLLHIMGVIISAFSKGNSHIMVQFFFYIQNIYVYWGPCFSAVFLHFMHIYGFYFIMSQDIILSIAPVP